MIGRWDRLGDGWLTCCAAGQIETGAVPSRPVTLGGARDEEQVVFDLTDVWGLTFDLLRDPLEWRERHVAEIVLGDGDSVDYSSSYQAYLSAELVEKYESRVEIGDYVRLFLPLAVRPKQLLFNPSFTGPEGAKASLLRREDISHIQAGYMAHLNIAAHFDRPASSSILLGISAYTRSNWWAHKKRAKPLIWKRIRRSGRDAWRVNALVSYLNDDLDPIEVEYRHVAEWLRKLEPAREALVAALGEGEDDGSASECILLAIPFMGLKPSRATAINLLVDDFVAAVEAMSQQERRIVAEYGRRWQAIVETVMPVGKICTISMSEQRQLEGTTSGATAWGLTDERWRFMSQRRSRRGLFHRSVGLDPLGDLTRLEMTQEIPFRDARSTHVEIRASDHSIEIDGLRMIDFEGQRIGAVDEVRETAGASAVYASDLDRPDYALVRVGVQASRDYRHLFSRLFYPLLLMAWITLILLPEGDHFVDALVLLTLPVTLASAFVLTREPTSLAQRLVRRYRVFLVLVIVGLWAYTVARLLNYAAPTAGPVP